MLHENGDLLNIVGGAVQEILQGNNIPQGTAYWEEICKSYPASGLAWCVSASLKLAAGDLEGAQQSAKEAIEHDNNHPEKTAYPAMDIQEPPNATAPMSPASDPGNGDRISVLPRNFPGRYFPVDISHPIWEHRYE